MRRGYVAASRDTAGHGAGASKCNVDLKAAFTGEARWTPCDMDVYGLTSYVLFHYAIATIQVT